MDLKLTGLCPLLEVFDMPTSLHFYRDVLGFEVVDSAPHGDNCDWCQLRMGSAELMLNTLYEHEARPATPDPERVAAHGDVSLFFGCSDLDSACSQLRASGLDLEPPLVRHYGMRQLSFNDPDGYNLCLQCPDT